MEIETRTPQSVAVSPLPASEQESQVVPVENVADEAQSQTGKDEEILPPAPADSPDSPETALADIVDDTNQCRQEESAASTPSADETRMEGMYPLRYHRIAFVLSVDVFVSPGKRKAADMDDSMSDSQRERKRPRDDSEPVDDEDTSKSPPTLSLSHMLIVYSSHDRNKAPDGPPAGR